MEREEKKGKRKGEDVENCADVSRKILEEGGRNRESGRRMKSRGSGGRS